MIIDEISRTTRIDRNYIDKLARSAGHRYKIYAIPKKRGGIRVIAHPSRQVKFLQRWVSKHVMHAFPLHDSCLGYRKKVSIRDVADLHKAQNFLLLMDFRDFFDSISDNDVFAFLKTGRPIPHTSFSDDDCRFITQVVTRNGSLPIGAPSSPVISNSIMFAFDKKISELCVECNVYYSRYADDMHFSTNETNLLGEIFREVTNIAISWPSPTLHVNENKTVFTSRKRRRTVVGLNLTSANEVSVGRKQKRKIKSFVHQYTQSQLAPEQLSYIRGYLAFLKMAEPSFVDSLQRKFGDETIARLGQAPIE